MSKEGNFLEVPKPGGLAPLAPPPNPNLPKTSTASATGD